MSRLKQTVFGPSLFPGSSHVPHKGSPCKVFPSQFQSEVSISGVIRCCWEILLYPAPAVYLLSSSISVIFYPLTRNTTLLKSVQLLCFVFKWRRRKPQRGEKPEKRYFSCYFPLISRAASARLLWNTLQSFQYFRPHQRTIKCHHLAGFSSLIVLSPPENSDIFHTKTGYTLLQQPLSILILFPTVPERVNSLLYMNKYVKVCK